MFVENCGDVDVFFFGKRVIGVPETLVKTLQQSTKLGITNKEEVRYRTSIHPATLKRKKMMMFREGEESKDVIINVMSMCTIYPNISTGHAQYASTGPFGIERKLKFWKIIVEHFVRYFADS